MGWFESAKKLLKRWKAGDSITNFTPRAQQVLMLARNEADRLKHNYIGTEHILLGLIALGQGVAVNVLGRLGLNLENIRTGVEKQTGIGPVGNRAAKAPYTPRVKKVLAFAREEAKTLHHTYIGTEHLLLGLLREGNGLAAIVLRDLNVDLEQLRIGILKELDPNFIPGKEVSKDWFKSAEELRQRWETEEVRFTPRAVQALAFSREEAARLHQNAVGTDHLLLGIIRLEKGVAVNVLKSLGVNLDITCAEVEKEAGTVSDETGSDAIPYTPQTNHVLKMAKEEAKTLNHTYIGVEHLLLGLLRESEGPAAEIFKHLEVDVEAARKKILEEINPI